MLLASPEYFEQILQEQDKSFLLVDCLLDGLLDLAHLRL